MGLSESPETMQNLKAEIFVSDAQVLFTQVCWPTLHVSAKWGARMSGGRGGGGWKTEMYLIWAADSRSVPDH